MFRAELSDLIKVPREPEGGKNKILPLLFRTLNTSFGYAAKEMLSRGSVVVVVGGGRGGGGGVTAFINLHS